MMTGAVLGLVFLATLPLEAQSERLESRLMTGQRANPIRRVVTMLQTCEKQVIAEGEKEKELFEKFMCWCKSGAGELGASISTCNTKIPDLGSEIEATIALIAQLEGELAQHQADRAAAKKAIEEATTVRTEEHKKFVEGAEEYKAQIAMIEKLMKVISTLSKAAYGGALLQERAGAATISSVQALLLSDKLDIADSDREALSSFLSQGSGAGSDEGYTPQSGEIIGMLKQMLDTMIANLNDGTKEETSKVNIFKGLLKAKLKEIDALSMLIEEKLKRIGDLKVKLVMLKEDLDDSEKRLAADTKSFAEMDKMCDDMKKAWEERQKTRSEELLAIRDTIQMLNSDDALDLFKKTLPSPSLLQVAVREEDVRGRALTLVQQAWHKKRSARLGLLALALSGKKVSMDKVVKMIDDMVALLKSEQVDDDDKKEYCEITTDHAEDKKKELERGISDLSKAIEDMEGGIATLKEEIKALGEGIVALDKSVAEATENRKEENSDYTDLIASDTAALEILEMAKNRLNKFYNPKLYKAPPTTTPVPNNVALMQLNGSAAPPPATFGAYEKKGEESNGVIGLLNEMKGDLELEMTQATAEEKNAQADYEDMMKDSAEERAADSKSIEEKVGALAALEGDLQEATAEKGSKEKELMATEKFLMDLHNECDWLIKNYGLRKEARASEIDALGKAKAVLNGADYSLIQIARAARSLRGS